MWFRQKTPQTADIAQGDSFRRARPFDIVETARIIDVAADHLGIPHVRYSVSVSGPMIATEDQRTLSLESFRNLYSLPLTV